MEPGPLVWVKTPLPSALMLRTLPMETLQKG